MKHDLEHLNFSNIVDLIQGDESVASEIISSLAEELAEKQKEIDDLEIKLRGAKYRKKSIITAGTYIAQHLKRGLPLVVKQEDSVIVVSTEDIKIQKNVIQKKKNP